MLSTHLGDRNFGLVMDSTRRHPKAWDESEDSTNGGSMLHRISLLAAVVIASLAVAVTPALAGEDDGNPATPPATGPTTPAPVPAPAPTVTIPKSYQHKLDKLTNEVKRLKHEAASESGSGGGGGGGTAGTSSSSPPTPTQTVAQTTTIPSGGVGAGAGGTAHAGSSDTLPAGLGIAGLVLVLAAG